jgi:rhamnogalacturonan endolyase
VLGDFSRADVEVAKGKDQRTWGLIWTPVRMADRFGKLASPNRSAEEFRHGDHYWQWGLYNLYPQEFPNDVDFVIGKSDWRRDWNYAHHRVPAGNGRWTNTTWRIGSI